MAVTVLSRDGTSLSANLRKTEVEKLHPGRRMDHDIAGLQIAVNHAGFVSGGECVRYLNRVLERSIQGQRTAAKHGRQRLTCDVFKDDIFDRAIAADIVDCTDVGVVQCRNGACLALCTGAEFRIAGRLGRQGLNGDVAAQTRIASPVHFAHTTASDQRFDAVRSELSVYSQH